MIVYALLSKGGKNPQTGNMWIPELEQCGVKLPILVEGYTRMQLVTGKQQLVRAEEH